MDIVLYLTEGIKPFVKENSVTDWDGFHQVFIDVHHHMRVNHKLTDIRKHVAPKTKEYMKNVRKEKGLDEKRDLMWSIFATGTREMRTVKMLYLFYISMVPVVCEVLKEYEEKRGSILLDLQVFVECPFCLQSVDFMLTYKGPKIMDNFKNSESPLNEIYAHDCSCGKTFNVVDDVFGCEDEE